MVSRTAEVPTRTPNMVSRVAEPPAMTRNIVSHGARVIPDARRDFRIVRHRHRWLRTRFRGVRHCRRGLGERCRSKREGLPRPQAGCGAKRRSATKETLATEGTQEPLLRTGTPNANPDGVAECPLLSVAPSGQMLSPVFTGVSPLPVVCCPFGALSVRLRIFINPTESLSFNI